MISALLSCPSPRPDTSRSTCSFSPPRPALGWDPTEALILVERERERRMATRAAEVSELRATAEQRRQSRRARDEARRGKERGAALLALAIAAFVSLAALLLASAAPPAAASPRLTQFPAASGE
jgi:hypothetical protein